MMQSKLLSQANSIQIKLYEAMNVNFCFINKIHLDGKRDKKGYKVKCCFQIEKQYYILIPVVRNVCF